MPAFNLFKRVSQAPTNPKPAGKPRQFDVADLYASSGSPVESMESGMKEWRAIEQMQV